MTVFTSSKSTLHVAVLVAEFVGADEDERVDAFLQLFDARHGLQFAAAAFAFHGHGDDADGEDAFVFGDFGHDGGCSSARAATHAGGDEEHLGVFVHQGLEFIAAHLGGFATDVGVVAGAQVALAEVHGGLDFAFQQGLVVGVAQDEIDALDAFFHHVVDGVASTTSHTDDFDIVRFVNIDGSEHLVMMQGCVVFCHSSSVLMWLVDVVGGKDIAHLGDDRFQV